MWDYRKTMPDVFDEAMRMTEANFEELNKIDLRKFLEDTRSSYWVT